MKKLSIIKKTQLLILIITTGVFVCLALFDQKFYENMQEHPSALWIYIMIWVVLVVCYLFMFLDFMYLSKIKSDYNSLNKVAYSDHLSGIPNRFSCDVIMEKYAGIPAPETIGCVMLEITNLLEINTALGHAQGNEVIKNFSALLSEASQGLCFVGRNGGNKFLAVFEDSAKMNANRFLSQLKEKTDAHNQEHHAHRIEYKVGIALNEDDKQNHLTELVSLANRRIYH